MSKKSKTKIIALIVLSLMVTSSYVPAASSVKAAETGGSNITAAAFGGVYDMVDNSLSTVTSGDTWTSTWAFDDKLYQIHDDGYGFDTNTGFIRNRLVQMKGNPNVSTYDFYGVNLNYGSLGNTLPQGVDGSPTGYSSSVYEQDGNIYLMKHANGSDYTQNLNKYASLLKSTDAGVNWINHLGQVNTDPPYNTNAMWTDLRFGAPTFIQYGMGGNTPGADNANNYVYLTSYDTSATGEMNPWRGVASDHVYLCRIQKSLLANLNKNDIQYYKGGDGMLDSSWSTDSSLMAPILTDNVNCHYPSVYYNYGLKRYVMAQYSCYFAPGEPGVGGGDSRFEIYTAEYPWGPWTKNLNYGIWAKTAANFLLPNKFTSTDGKKMWMCFSGGFDGNLWQYGYQYMPVYLSTGTVDQYQAESAALTGLSANTSYPSYTGTGYITGFDTVGDKAVFTVNNVNGTGWHIVKIRYASTNTNGNNLSVVVNGRTVKVIKLSHNNSDYKTSHNWADRSDIYYLNHGANTIELVLDTGNSGVGLMIDRIDVSREQTYNEGTNIAFNATVTASSSYSGYAPGGAINGCASGYPLKTANEWASNGQKAGAWLNLSWGASQSINKVVLYDRPNTNDQVTSGTLSFSDGTSINVGKLQNDGQAGTIVTFPAKNVTWVRFTVNSVKGTTENIGLSEMEVYQAPTGTVIDGYWNFNETSGNIARDSSGHLRYGAVYGTPTWSSGHAGNAINLNGTNNYVRMFDEYNPVEFTMMAWIKADAANNRNIFCRSSYRGPALDWSQQVRINSSGKFEALVAENAGGTKSVVGTTTAAAGTWYHVALTVKNGGQMKLYINGVPEGTPQNVTTMWQSGDRFYIGSNAAGNHGVPAQGYFDGLIDDVKMYYKELTQSEIQAAMN